MPYTADMRRQPPSSDELRGRIPGWGADLDPADRPSVPREKHEPTGAHWDFPERQPENTPRERSLEHKFLTPAFGTTAPLHGASGAIRRFAYRRYSEGQTPHWLLLLAGDRVDAWPGTASTPGSRISARSRRRIPTTRSPRRESSARPATALCPHDSGRTGRTSSTPGWTRSSWAGPGPWPPSSPGWEPAGS